MINSMLTCGAIRCRNQINHCAMASIILVNETIACSVERSESLHLGCGILLLLVFLATLHYVQPLTLHLVDSRSGGRCKDATSHIELTFCSAGTRDTPKVGSRPALGQEVHIVIVSPSFPLTCKVQFSCISLP
jgi:hypothetical protein